MVCKLLSHGGEILIPDRLLERRLRETETRLERFSRETDKAVENLRTLRQTLDGEESASKSRSEQIRDSHRIPLQMHGWFLSCRADGAVLWAPWQFCAGVGRVASGRYLRVILKAADGPDPLLTLVCG